MLVTLYRLVSSHLWALPMLSLAQFLALCTLAASVAHCDLVFPAYQGVPDDINAYNFNGTTTESNSITSTVYLVDQKSGTPPGALPNLPAAKTTITALDGDVVNVTVPITRRGLSAQVQNQLSRRNNSNYELVFWGTGTDHEDRDASIEGTAYLTYTLVDNSTYNIDDCLLFCASIPGCVFVNLYYEFNNYLLDHVFSQQSNLKCAAYGDVHSAAEKTNYGGESLSDTSDGPLSYIQQSTGWSSKALCDPSTPDGYDPVGEFRGANEAPGYMGFVFLDQYDVEACASICNIRDADTVGGSCKYFNIWRALVDGIPTTYTCSLYYIPTDASTAINYGQGDLVVTKSRGYTRKTYLPDGGFEQYNCDEGLQFCFTEMTSTWSGSSPEGGYYDASIFHYELYAHSGSSVALLGSAYGYDNYAGTLTPATSLATQPGVRYNIEFFHSSFFSGQEGEENAFVQVLWNGVVIGTIRPGYSPWKYYKFCVVGQGNDELSFVGGAAPSYDFLDDIFVFQT